MIRSKPEPVQQPAVEPVLETASEQPELPPMPLPTPDSVVPDAPEWAAAPIPEPSVAEVDAATPGMDLDDEPPLDEDYIEPDMDSAYSYLDDLASEHTAEPAPNRAGACRRAGHRSGPAMAGTVPEPADLRHDRQHRRQLHADRRRWRPLAVAPGPGPQRLFNATQQRRLNDALNQYHGRTLTLTIELIKPEQETPAQAASRRRANRQREAEESIHGDPFIQQMMQQFGAVVRTILLNLSKLWSSGLITEGVRPAGPGAVLIQYFEVIPMMKGGMAGLMKQAQQMQEKMAKMQEELANAEVTGKAGGDMVTVVMTGRHDVKRVEHRPKPG
jgi:DNA polymerase-3 subunit gamma/tau